MLNSKWFTVDRAAWVVLALAALLLVVIRVRLADFPLERDEGEYAYAGQLILEGIPPYKLAYNMKLPGTYLAYAGLMAIFGQTTAGIHFGLLAVGLVTIWFIFLLGRDLFDPMSGAFAAVAYAILSTDAHVLGQAAHATHFVAVFGVAGAWVLWRAMKSAKIWMFPLAGFLLGAAFIMKQQGVFLPCFGGLMVLVFCAGRRPIVSGRNAAVLAGYAAGAIAPFAAVCAWLWTAGTFYKFWFWTIEYARHYVDQIPLGVAFQIFWTNTKDVMSACWPLWLLAAAGVAVAAFSKGVAGRRTMVFSFLAASFLCVCPGFYFRQHYYIVLLPCAAILAGVGAVWLAGSIYKRLDALFSQSVQKPAAPIHKKDRKKTAAAPSTDQPDAVGLAMAAGAAFLLPCLAIIISVWNLRDYYFVWSPEKACRRIYGANPFLECPVIADYIKKNSRPEDRVAVLGSEPEVYFDSQRKSATGYIYTYALMESHPFAATMQDEMIAEIEAAKPEYMVVANVPTSWLPRPNSVTRIFQWMNRYIAANYRPVGLADIVSENETEYKWGDAAVGVKPKSDCHLWVFRRK